jgi:cytochrome P450
VEHLDIERMRLTIAASVAGADSVAISLRSIFYHLMQHPKSFQTCAAEVSAAGARGLLSRPVKYKETISHLPYTCACITEASRLFPSFQIHMGRIAPREGLELSGYYIPAGYRVGMNAGVVQLDRALFGQDSCDFRPERWLESPERNLVMGKGMLRFGAGTRTCSGKHVSGTSAFSRRLVNMTQIATVELHKLVPEVLRDFQIKMAHNRGWKLRNAGFVKQKDLIVKVTWK